MKKMARILTSIIFTVLLCVGASVFAEAERQTVGFVVQDYTGEVTNQVYRSWRRSVKDFHNVLTYDIKDGAEAVPNINAVLVPNTKVDATLLADLAEQNKLDVLVVMRVRDLTEDYVRGFSLRPDADDYMYVAASADLYMYKKQGNIFLKKFVREQEWKELGNYDHPEELVKTDLMKLLQKMRQTSVKK